MTVGICRLVLMAPGSHSLKEKRMVLRRIKDKTRLKFNVAIAEVGDQDAWQRMSLGFAVVANERAFAEKMLGEIASYIDGLAEAKVIDEDRDILSYNEGEKIVGDGVKHWEPES